MIEEMFTVDGVTGFHGYHDPLHTWNGWCVPYFTVSEIARIVADINKQQAEIPGMDYRIEIEQSGDEMVVSVHDMGHEYTWSESAAVTIEGENVFCFMGYDWEWTVVEQEII